MKYGEFMAALRQKGLQHVYLLAGEEHYYIEKAEQRLLAMLFPKGEGQQDALQRLSGDPAISELVGLIETVPFFADKNVILLRGTNLFHEKKGAAPAEGKGRKSRAEKEQEQLMALLAAMPETSYVIFEADGKADKRKRLYKAVEKAGAVLEAEPVRAWRLSTDLFHCGAPLPVSAETRRSPFSTAASVHARKNLLVGAKDGVGCSSRTAG